MGITGYDDFIIASDEANSDGASTIQFVDGSSYDHKSQWLYWNKYKSYPLK